MCPCNNVMHPLVCTRSGCISDLPCDRRQYRVDLAGRILSFLDSVKNSLSKLGVDAAKLTRITHQVGFEHAFAQALTKIAAT